MVLIPVCFYLMLVRPIDFIMLFILLLHCCVFHNVFTVLLCSIALLLLLSDFTVYLTLLPKSHVSWMD